jgi:catechol 2,3-dioxygenase-like lactoylglutathione lyase family enzyme
LTGPVSQPMYSPIKHAFTHEAGHLHLYPPLSRAPPGERFVLHLCQGFAPLEPGNSGIAFVTDDIDALVARMTKGGVNFPEPLKKEEWERMAKFADPDGNIFWLLEATTKMVRATLNSRAPVRKMTVTKPGERRRKA